MLSALESFQNTTYLKIHCFVRLDLMLPDYFNWMFIKLIVLTTAIIFLRCRSKNRLVAILHIPHNRSFSQLDNAKILRLQSWQRAWFMMRHILGRPTWCETTHQGALMQSEILGGQLPLLATSLTCASTIKLGKIRVFSNKGHFLKKDNCIFAYWCVKPRFDSILVKVCNFGRISTEIKIRRHS